MCKAQIPIPSTDHPFVPQYASTFGFNWKENQNISIGSEAPKNVWLASGSMGDICFTGGDNGIIFTYVKGPLEVGKPSNKNERNEHNHREQVCTLFYDKKANTLFSGGLDGLII